jgi:hypothetical protein
LEVEEVKKKKTTCSRKKYVLKGLWSSPHSPGPRHHSFPHAQTEFLLMHVCAALTLGCSFPFVMQEREEKEPSMVKRTCVLQVPSLQFSSSVEFDWFDFVIKLCTT